MSNIVKIIGREILDSRGYPTIESEVHIKGGFIGLASVPSGSSVGKKEALELRDNNKKYYMGKGVTKAVEAINGPLSKVLLGKNSNNQKNIDNIMIDLDGSNNKSKFGANAILSLSLSIAKAFAKSQGMKFYEYISELNGTPNKFSMPIPMINIINGGKHANNNIDIQEFMIQPVGAKNFKEAVRMGSEIFHNLGKILKKNGMTTSVGDEGGYAPNIQSNETALKLISQAIKISNYELGKDIMLAIDCAASELYNKKIKKYVLKSENKIFSSEEFTFFLKKLIKKYKISSIEDGMDQSDWKGFLHQTKTLGKKIQIVGDDLFVTNSKILKKGIKYGIANAILIKLNQIGSLTETLKTINLAKKHGYSVIISHRSGETEDVSISDLSVGTSSGQIKAGSMSRTDRISKYNQLIRIEEYLGNKVSFSRIKK